MPKSSGSVAVSSGFSRASVAANVIGPRSTLKPLPAVSERAAPRTSSAVSAASSASTKSPRAMLKPRPMSSSNERSRSAPTRASIPSASRPMSRSPSPIAIVVVPVRSRSRITEPVGPRSDQTQSSRSFGTLFSSTGRSSFPSPSRKLPVHVTVSNSDSNAVCNVSTKRPGDDTSTPSNAVQMSLKNVNRGCRVPSLAVS